MLYCQPADGVVFIFMVLVSDTHLGLWSIENVASISCDMPQIDKGF